MGLDSADETQAYDYILSTWMSPAVVMQLAHLSHVTNAFDVQGGVIAHKFENGDRNKPQSEFYETKQRTIRTMKIVSHVARGTISDPATLIQQTFCVTPTDIHLNRTSHGVEAKISVGQPALKMPGSGIILRMIKPILLRIFEQIFTEMQGLYASDKVPLPSSVDVAKNGHAIVVDGAQRLEAQNATGATFGSMSYGGVNYGI